MSCGSYYVTSKSSFPLNSHLLRHQFNLVSLSHWSLPSPPSSLCCPCFHSETDVLSSQQLSLSLILPPLAQHFPLSVICSLGAFLLLTLQPTVLHRSQVLFEYIIRIEVTFLSAKTNSGCSPKPSREFPLVYMQWKDSCPLTPFSCDISLEYHSAQTQINGRISGKLVHQQREHASTLTKTTYGDPAVICLVCTLPNFMVNLRVYF